LPKAQPWGGGEAQEITAKENSDFFGLQDQLPQGFSKTKYENKTVTIICSMALKL